MNITDQATQVLAETEEQIAICDNATARPWKSIHLGSLNGQETGSAHLTVGEYSAIEPTGFSLRIRNEDSDFIASARTVCPKALRCLKTAMNVFLSDKQWNEQTTSYELRHDSLVALTAIITQWNENK